jgi:PST family polysaccharide transporter
MKAGLRAATFNGILTILRMLSNLAIAKFMAIYAGPAGLAVAGQLQGVAAAATGVVSASMSTGLLRYTAQHRDGGFEACSPWWSAGLRWAAGLYLLMAVVLIGGAQPLAQWLFRDGSLWWATALVAIAAPFAAASIGVPAVLNGLAHHKTYLIASTVAVTVSTAIALLLIHRQGGQGALIVAGSYAGIVGLCTVLACLRQPWLRWRFWLRRVESSQLRGIGNYVAMAAASALFTPLAQVVIRNLIYADAGWDQVGFWQASQKISDAYMTILASALSAYYVPRVARANGRTEIEAAASETIKIVAAIAITSSAGVIAARELLAVLLYSPAFMPAADYLAFHAAGNALRAMSLVYGYVILSRGASTWFIALEAIFSLSLVALSWALITASGPTGASAAYALNYALYLFTVRRGFFKFANVT